MLIGSLGLPLGTEGMRQASQDMRDNPVRIIIQMVVFQVIVFVILPWYLTWRENHKARKII